MRRAKEDGESGAQRKSIKRELSQSAPSIKFTTRHKSKPFSIHTHTHTHTHTHRFAVTAVRRFALCTFVSTYSCIYRAFAAALIAPPRAALAHPRALYTCSSYLHVRQYIQTHARVQLLSHVLKYVCARVNRTIHVHTNIHTHTRALSLSLRRAGGLNLRGCCCRRRKTFI